MNNQYPAVSLQGITRVVRAGLFGSRCHTKGMHMLSTLRFVGLSSVLVLSLACCDSGDEEGAESEGNTEGELSFEDLGNEMAFDRLSEELPSLRAAIEGDSGENSISCAGNLSYANRLQNEEEEAILAVANEVLEICGILVPLMEARAELAEAQAKRAEDPAAIIAGNCSMARSKLGTAHENFAADERISALGQEIDAFCN